MLDQLIGAIALHYGTIAEMKTGEGKTLVATMPLMLNSLKPEPLEDTVLRLWKKIEKIKQENPTTEIQIINCNKEAIQKLEEYLDFEIAEEKVVIPPLVRKVQDIKRFDLHIHTNYSDGVLSPEEIVETAKKFGLEAIGISDHFLTQKMDIRNTINNKEKFIQYLNTLEELSAKTDIQILKGIEIDASILNPLLHELPYEYLNKLDYVLFENVCDKNLEALLKENGIDGEAVLNLDQFLEIRKKLAIPVGLAHNAIHENFKLEDMKKLAEADVFIEINAHYKVYNNPKFWEFLKEFIKWGGKISIATDTHYPEIYYSGEYEKLLDIVKKNGLENALVDFVNGKSIKKKENGVVLNFKEERKNLSSHLATVNEYLAQRDAEWMGPIYEALGFSVGLNLSREGMIIVNEELAQLNKNISQIQEEIERSLKRKEEILKEFNSELLKRARKLDNDMKMLIEAEEAGLVLPNAEEIKQEYAKALKEIEEKRDMLIGIEQKIGDLERTAERLEQLLEEKVLEEKRKAYEADIVYSTNTEFGFDYLRDNLAKSPNEQVQRKLNYVIIDEIDNILIDEARIPLIISGSIYLDDVDKKLHVIFDKIVKEMIKEQEEGLELYKELVREEFENKLKLLSLSKKIKNKKPSKRKLKKLKSAYYDYLERKIDEFFEEYDSEKVWFDDGERKEGYAYFKIDKENRKATFTNKGIEILIRKAKDYGVLFKDKWDEGDIELFSLADLALNVNLFFEKGKHYLVLDNEIILIDQNTGRLAFGKQYSKGVHQAIQAKEDVEITDKNPTIAEIAQQNYFLMYDKLAGMTGTAKEAEEEFMKTLGLSVVQIPTNEKMIRIDHDDEIYKDEETKYKAIIKDIIERHKKGQPILIGTLSVEKSNWLSEKLTELGIPHEVLNAERTYQNEKREAEIIAKAGRKGAVTIATNMAGRGTDIKLDEEAKKLGGLYVLGTERNENRRIDNQLRGRSGRQGDPGESKFYISPDDDLMKRFTGNDVIKYLLLNIHNSDEPIKHRLLTRAVNKAQKRLESMYAKMREHMLGLDNVLDLQRKAIYHLRNCALKMSSKVEEHFIWMLEDVLKEKISEKNDLESKLKSINEVFPASLINAEDEGKILEDVKRVYEKIKEYVDKNIVREIIGKIMLDKIDSYWMLHMENMEYLKENISFRAYGMVDPIIAFKQEAKLYYDSMIKDLKKDIVKNVFYNLFRVCLKSIAEKEGKSVNEIDFASYFGGVRKTKQKRIYTPREMSIGIDAVTIMPGEYHVKLNPNDENAVENAIVDYLIKPNLLEKQKKKYLDEHGNFKKEKLPYVSGIIERFKQDFEKNLTADKHEFIYQVSE